MTKAELLRLVNREWQQLVGKISSLPRDVLEKPKLLEEWSVKDMMSHLSYREGIALERLSAILKSGKIQFDPRDDVVKIKEEEVEKRRSESLENIQRSFELVHTELVRAVDRFPEEKIQSDDQNVMEWLAENTFKYYGRQHDKLKEALAKLDHR